MKGGPKTTFPRMVSLCFAIHVASAVISPTLMAQVDHSPNWLSATNLTYGLVDLDGFLPGGYGYCHWGNYMDYNTFGTVDLGFSWLTAPPYSNANTDLFITRSDLPFLQRETYGGLQFPTGALWTVPNGPFSRGVVQFSATQNQVNLYRYLHFRNQLTDEVSGAALPTSARKLVILIHGWNSDSLSDSFSTSEFASLVSALKATLTNSDWRLVRYHWEADADTGMIDLLTILSLGATAINDATEAAEISNQHGQHLGELLSRGFPNLEKIQLIAHSAGSWAARATARSLLQNLPNASVQITLLDPFIPTAGGANSVLSTSAMDTIAAVSGSQQLKRLENYYSEDITGSSTQQLFVDWNLNQRVYPAPNSQSFYASHSGPIQFYADTVQATLAGQSAIAGLAPFDVRPTSPVRIGWTRSLFYNEPLIQQNPQSQIAVVGATVTLSSTASSRNSGASDSSVTYQWRRNGANLPGATNATLRINSAQSSDAGAYTVTVSNAWGATTSSAATLSVVSPLIIATQPLSQTLTIGSNLTLSVSASGGTGSFTYQWRFNGAPLLNGANSTYTASNIGTGFTGTFDVVITDGVTIVTSTPAVITVVVSGAAPTIVTQPQNQTANAGQTITFNVAANGSPAPTYQWQFNGRNLVGATNATLALANIQPANAGLYTALIANSAGSATSDTAIVGVATTNKVIGTGSEVGANIPHPNGNIYDQVLLSGAAATVTADAGQVTRTSFIDLTNDIVQVEFGGAGTLSMVLDNPSGPAAPLNYNQPTVTYMKGHVGIVITGADDTTNVSVFSVGRFTAFDPTGKFNSVLPISSTNDPANNGSSLFFGKASTTFDGLADLAFIAISSTNGKFGGLRASNGSFYATKGMTGIYAPGVTFTGPVFIGDINASDAATPVIIIGSSPDTRITGGDLLQANGQPVKVSGLTQLKFTAGSDSNGNALTAKTNKATLQQDGVDVTAQIIVNP